MKGGVRKLFLVELRRQWTLAAFFVPVALAVLALLMAVATARMQREYSVAAQAVSQCLSFVLPLAAAIAATGAISHDVKDGWLRTLLIRPITRQQYLLVKLAAVYSTVFVNIIVAGVLPNVITAAWIAKIPVQYDLVQVLSVYMLILLQGLLYVVILMFLSCWVPGVFNVVILGLWSILASMVGAYIQAVHWMDKWLVLLKDYFFPSGFWDAIGVIIAGPGVPVTQLAWGLGALSVFLALTFWSISVIQVDKSSE